MPSLQITMRRSCFNVLSHTAAIPLPPSSCVRRSGASNPMGRAILGVALGTLGVLTMGASAEAAAQPDPQVRALLSDISAQRIEQNIRTLAAFGTRHTASETDSETRGIGAARRWVERELRACSADSGGRLQVSTQQWVEPASRTLAVPTTLVNVIAELPGDSPASRRRVLVVSGHYDSRATDLMDAAIDAPGSNDDASGTAVSIELACTMAKQHFDATLVFIAVAGEEQGLFGSAHYAQQAQRDDVNIEAMITNDIVGSSIGDHGQRDAKRLRLFADGSDPLRRLSASSGSSAETSPMKPERRAELQTLALAGGTDDLPTQQFARHLVTSTEQYLPGFTVQLVQRRDRYLRGGDHIPFLERGYTAVRFTEPFEHFDHQHQTVRQEGQRVYGDLPEFVDYAFVADVARVNAAGLATLALAPAAPKEVRIDASELTNDTTLFWAASSDPAIAGWRVLWRDTGALHWEHSQDVNRATTQLTLPVSKDNVVFGVQSVSARGHASLASYPLPFRR